MAELQSFLRNNPITRTSVKQNYVIISKLVAAIIFFFLIVYIAIPGNKSANVSTNFYPLPRSDRLPLEGYISKYEFNKAIEELKGIMKSAYNNDQLPEYENSFKMSNSNNGKMTKKSKKANNVQMPNLIKSDISLRPKSSINDFDLLNSKYQIDHSLDFVKLVDLKTKKIFPKYANYFPPYKISKNPAKELEACLFSEYDCKSFPELESAWPVMPEEYYDEAIRDVNKHTSYKRSEVEFLGEKNQKSCEINGEVTLKFTAKNRLGERKLYGGDFILARMVPVDFPKYWEQPFGPKGWTNYKDFDETIITIIPGSTSDHKDGTYTIKIPCKLPGQFRVEVILIRNSETISALLKIFNVVNTKSRIIKAILEDGGESDQCGAFLPDMLPGGDTSRVCPIHTQPGREWFCQRPNTSDTCSNKIIWQGNHKGKEYMRGSWSVNKITNPLRFDEVYEDIVFYDDITVQSQNQNSRSLPSESHHKIPGYWYKGQWLDRVLPSVSQEIPKLKIKKDRTFIKFGDSLVGQVMGIFRQETTTYLKEHPGLYKNDTHDKANFPTQGDFNFLGLEEYFTEDCLPLNGWGAMKSYNPLLNHTGVLITAGLPIMKDQCPGKTIFSGDVLERMIKEGGKEWFGPDKVVFFTHGMHFHNDNPIIFYNRLIDLRNVIRKFKKVSPDTIFIYKTVNYLRGDFTKNYATTSAFQAFRQREIAFRVFGNPYLDDISSDEFPVKVYDVFPMTLVAFDYMVPGNVHPPRFLRRNSADLMVDLMRYVEYI